MNLDWKDALKALHPDAGPDPGTRTPEPEPEPVAARPPILTLFYESKGRAGKPATIIAGFDPDDNTLPSQTAATLKKRLGCGGSARGGEILLQGDRRRELSRLLPTLGFKVKNPMN